MGEIKPPYDRNDLRVVDQFDSELDGDRKVIDQLLAAGSDVSQPRHTIHFLYFPSHEIADGAARALSGAGYNAGTYDRLDLERDNVWPVIAEITDLVNEQVLQRDRAFLSAFAASLGGEYDGFETEMS